MSRLAAVKCASDEIKLNQVGGLVVRVCDRNPPTDAKGEGTMRRILIVVALLVIAAIAGVVRSHTRITKNGIQFSASGGSQYGEARDEIRKSYELSPGAQVEVRGINGAVRVETSNTKTAEIYIVRSGKDSGALTRRKIVIENTASSLIIRNEKGDAGFFDCLFGSNPTEHVTLKLPRQISLLAKGVNGSVSVGDLDGSIQVTGVNGRVEVGQATRSAEFRGINGNIAVTLKQLESDGVIIKGINGNIELRLADGLNADLEAHGMNGSVRSEVTEIAVNKSEHGNRYFAHIGAGGNPITLTGVNGNVRLTRLTNAAIVRAEESKNQS
jgi:hypothetical protein